jgi:hypothetical protein
VVDVEPFGGIGQRVTRTCTVPASTRTKARVFTTYELPDTGVAAFGVPHVLRRLEVARSRPRPAARGRGAPPACAGAAVLETFEGRARARHHRGARAPDLARPLMRTRHASLQDRLLANSMPEDNGYEIDGQPSECWLWLGNRDHKGYGRLNVRKGSQHFSARAHRVSFEFFMGVKLKDGQTLDHRCRVVGCIHPNHLEPMTRADNTRLMRHYWAKRSAEEAGQQEICT